ncbi:uncharacterized protein C19orf57 homolog isoform X2 [Octodon degus]|uniref:Uncharacterized protein C19orf57 homolog isoform X2 n=1 Tax=Octodon degus TaxID=10160 RepID=A0A6P6EVB4_OCTDE|nr:uncharacterized protein C19orf57 homolog isoform X2 [Octodon degus]
MSKRKKLRTAGIHPPKPPKNPQPGDSNGDSQSSKLGGLPPTSESEDSLTSAAPAEPSRQEPGPAISSLPQEETIATSFLGQPEKEAAPLPASQTSLGRFVPQFAKPRKTVTRKAEIREEDPERRAVSLETLPSPSAPWLLEGFLGPGELMAKGSPHPEQSGQKPGSPVPGEGTGSSNSETAGQDPVSEERTSTVDDGNDVGSSGPEEAQGSGSLEGQLPCSGAEGTQPDQGAPQENGTQHRTPEGGGSITSAPVRTPTLATLCVKTWASVQDHPGPRQIPRGTGGQAECKWDGPAYAPLGTTIIENMSTDAPETKQGILGVARPGVQADTTPSASPMEQTPQGCVSLSENTAGGRGEIGPEDKPSSDMPGSPAAFPAVILGNQEPALGTQDPGHPELDMGPGVDETQAPVVEWPERAQLGDIWAVESGSQHLEGGCVGLSPVLPALSPLEHRAAASGHILEAKAHPGSLETPTPPPDPLQHPLDSAGQAEWAESSAMELDFLPDSQLQDALDAPNLEVLPEQGRWQPGCSLIPCGDV